MISKNILETVGNTPLIQLNRITGRDDARILVKYEGMNAGGSIKIRTALKMIDSAEQSGRLNHGMTIVEPTSGNQGIGLAMVGAVKGYHVLIIMPDSVSEERRKIISQYGAEVRLIHDSGNIGVCIAQCMMEARRLAEDPNYFMPNQFVNEDNVTAQYEGTGREILQQADSKIDAFCSGIGTGGTITGIGRSLKEANPEILIVAAEPEHAAILSGRPVGNHLQMGIGDGIIPDILDQRIYRKIEIITDQEAIDMSRKLAALEGILCGISSGTNVTAALRTARYLGRGKTVVTVLPDTGERYFSTPLFD
ncbi:MAG: cysteine synthase family protein [Erysipelotrichia bacterium]|nr:cysteine synthase family protein [Erysipelotrichia bacterium]